ncbi:MAG: ATP-binding cassette domain-containing protein [Chloroflexi bacterium]|nr:ATP-binding cassette domain-containing protein [Chloroflexota bacterium]
MSIILTNLTKRYDSNVVVNDVSLEVHDGELFVLLGGSGSGKSTILRMIAGLVEPENGRIELNGRDVTYLPPQERGTGFVFQNYSIFRHMTVAQNVEFGLQIRRVPSEKRQQRSAELLELVGLAGLGGRYADQLSGGQQQRVALARALAYEPAVLLLDEPFGALDVKIRAQLRKSLREIQRQLGVTTILVTHDQEEAFELADRIGVVHRGRLVEVGQPEALYHRPRTELAATFIGGGNVIVGRKAGGSIRLGQITLPMPPDAPPHDEGAPVRILFRPETVLLQTEPYTLDQGVHSLGQGEIREMFFTGALQRLTLAVDNLRGARPLSPSPAYGQRTTPIEAARPSDASSEADFQPGRSVWLGLRYFHVLDPAGLKLLIYADDSAAGAVAASFGCRLGQAAGGPVTLLALASAGDQVAETQSRLEKAVSSWLPQLPHLETRVRQGGIEEILREAQAGSYEVVVLGQPTEGADPELAADNHRLQQLLLRFGVSVLLAPAARNQVKRVLICTAGGEPGKSDVRLGGRIARRTGARVTAFHVPPTGSAPKKRERAERHLAQAQASLEALGVISDVKIGEGMVVDAILREAEQGDYDLVVIGAPAPLASQQLVWSDLTGGIVARAKLPLLVVPMEG